ncbi:MAG TPA: hypothetical protein VLE23_13825 [Geminicoccaceae bacterium]|nr:hypothetical protein [Geminicoccaceae bacterium]
MTRAISGMAKSEHRLPGRARQPSVRLVGQVGDRSSGVGRADHSGCPQ